MVERNIFTELDERMAGINTSLDDLGSDFFVSLENISKLNGEEKAGLRINYTIPFPDVAMSPILYPTEDWLSHSDGEIADLLHNMVNAHRDDTINLPDLDEDYIKANVYPCICSYDGNAEDFDRNDIYWHNYSSQIDDIIVYYRVRVEVMQCGEVGEGSFKLTNKTLDTYHIDRTNLRTKARQHAYKTYRLQSLKEVLEELMPELPQADIPMYILSNETRLNGAGVIISWDVRYDVVQKLKALGIESKRVMLLPSSVHEWIIIEPTGMQLDGIIDIIRSINSTEVDGEDVLLDYPLFLNMVTCEVEVMP